MVEFGAIGDGETLNTHAIQAAVNECSKNGGGTVHFPAGTYLSGTIYLKDYVKLNLSSGALLLGSDQVDDYPLNKCDFPSYSDKYVGRALICDDVHGLKLFNFDAQVSRDVSAQIILRNSHDAFISGCQPEDTDAFLLLEKNSSRIQVE